MEIYTFDSPFNTVMNVIYAIGAIALAVLSFFIIKFWIAQVIAYRKDKTKFPKILMVFFAILMAPCLFFYREDKYKEVAEN